MILKRRLYTKYDETDSLKRMKDSDILAATPKSIPTPSAGSIGLTTASGALIGSGIGAAAGGLMKKGVARGGKYGAIIGAGLGALRSMNKTSNNGTSVEDIEFYNRRLKEAQKWARRRERLDWKNNITGRQGYSY